METNQIHPTASIGENVVLGKYNVIGPNVVIEGHTTIGSGNYIGAGTVIGTLPQVNALVTKGFTKIGNNNKFSEYVVVHSSGNVDGTVIGNNNQFYINTHVAHDCNVGDNCRLINGTGLAGNVTIQDNVEISANCCISNHVVVGEYSFIAGQSGVVQNVPPYTLVGGGYHAGAIAYNKKVKILRYNEPDIESICKILFREFYLSDKNVANTLARMESTLDLNIPYIKKYIDFIKQSNKGVVSRYRSSNGN